MKKKIMIAFLFVILIAATSYTVYRVITWQQSQVKIAALESSPSIRYFTAADLQQFGGSTPEQPIYLALDGYVYDVTAGSRFYAIGGDYHYLAGRDATDDLRIFGGDIIKRKYPVIGKYTTAAATPLSTPQN